jgi:hypothetical protein
MMLLLIFAICEASEIERKRVSVCSGCTSVKLVRTYVRLEVKVVEN